MDSGGPKKILDESAEAPLQPLHLANTTEPSVCGGDVALCQVTGTLTTCFCHTARNTGVRSCQQFFDRVYRRIKCCRRLLLSLAED